MIVQERIVRFLNHHDSPTRESLLKNAEDAAPDEIIPVRQERKYLRLGWVSASIVVYILLFDPLVAAFGVGVVALAALPVALTGWLLGWRVGLAAGLAAILVNTLLFHLVGLAGWDVLVRYGGGPGILMLALIGLGAGCFGERMHRATLYTRALAAERVRLTQQMVERREIEDALRANEQDFRDLFTATLRQAQELGLLDRIRTALARELDLPVILHTVVEEISSTFGYSQVSLYLLEGEDLVLQHQVGYDQVIARIPITQGISGRVVRTGEPVLVEDVRGDPTFLGAIEGIVSEICVPLWDQDRTVGMLNVESVNGVKLTEPDLRVMLAVSEHVNIAIGRARLYMAARESETRYRSVITALHEGILVLGPQGQILTWNTSATQLLGVSVEELQTRTFYEIDWRAIAEDGSPFPPAAYPAHITLQTGVAQRDVVMGIHQPHGTLVWITVNTQPLFQAHSATPSADAALYQAKLSGRDRVVMGEAG